MIGIEMAKAQAYFAIVTVVNGIDDNCGSRRSVETYNKDNPYDHIASSTVDSLV